VFRWRDTLVSAPPPSEGLRARVAPPLETRGLFHLARIARERVPERLRTTEWGIQRKGDESMDEQENKRVSRRKFLGESSKTALAGTAAAFLGLGVMPTTVRAAVTSCTLFCSGSCSGSCSGACEGGCSGSCSGTCLGTCEGGCGEGCTGTCAGSCSGGCTGCAGSCVGGCTGSCSGTCTGGCDTSCSGTCSGDCSGTCSGTCAGTSQPGALSASAETRCGTPVLQSDISDRHIVA